MALLNLNLSDPLMKAIKAVNSITGKSLTEDDLKKGLAKVQDYTDEVTKKIDEVIADKEKEIME